MTNAKPNQPETGDAMNEAIARRVASLRKSNQLTFDALAARSDISKGMLVQIEQGRANPSISTLCKLAAALRVSVADLVDGGDHPHRAVRIVAPGSAPVLWQGSKGGAATLLVGSEGPDMLELWEWSMLPGEKFESRPHPAGTQELLNVIEGTLALEIDGQVHLVGAGAAASARTDCAHSYACHGKKKLRFAMVVYENAAKA
ncbi:helix-turn-helix domain-containing protein [Dongia sp.]|uniref:helix-turn-helix domain-containing protein n=1 Tax=Dongia sp. TaxID=1977262 RepID=UPI0037505169